jgi:hypothetical protein
MIYWLAIKAFFGKFWPFLLIGAILFAGWAYVDSERQQAYLTGKAEVQSLWEATKAIDAQAQAEAEARHAADKEAWEKGLLAVQKGYSDEIAKTKAVGDRALADNRSLRNALAATSGSGGPVPSPPGSACGPHDQYIGLLKRLLGESGDLVAEGLVRVAKLEAKIAALQETIRVYLARSKSTDV